MAVTSALPPLPNLDVAWLAIPLAGLIYLLLLYDARRSGSPAAGDDQLGIKTVAATLAVVGTWVIAHGLQVFLLTILTFDDVWDRMKTALPSLLVGTLVVAGAGLVIMSRTNAARFPKAKRAAAGVVALVSGVALVPALVGFLEVLLDWPSWRQVASAFSTVVTAAVVFLVALAVLGTLSGVRMPERLARSSTMGPGGGAGLGQPFGGMVPPQPGPSHPAPGHPAPGMQPPIGAQTMQGFPPPGPAAPGSQPPSGWPPG